MSVEGGVLCVGMLIRRVGQDHIYTVFLAGKSPNIRSYTVRIYGSGQLHSYLYMLLPTPVRGRDSNPLTNVV